MRDVEIASIGYSEPSLVFLGGTDLKFVTIENGAKFVSEAGCRVVLIELRHEKLFMEALGDKANLVHQTGSVQGYKLNAENGSPLASIS